MLRKNILVIFISIIFASTACAGSYFAYSTNGKSPGLRALGGSARSVATSFGLIASPDLFSLDIRNFASWSDRENTQFTFSFEGTGYSLELESGEKIDWSQVVFNDIAVNIPIFKNKFSFGFGFSPLTNSTIGFSQSDSIGQIIQRFRGNMSDGYANFSFKISDEFRAGIGILAVFGDLVDEFKVITVDENYISNFVALHEYKILQPNLVLSGAYSDSTLFSSGQAIIPFEVILFIQRQVPVPLHGITIERCICHIDLAAVLPGPMVLLNWVWLDSMKIGAKGIGSMEKIIRKTWLIIFMSGRVSNQLRRRVIFPLLVRESPGVWGLMHLF